MYNKISKYIFIFTRSLKYRINPFSFNLESILFSKGSFNGSFTWSNTLYSTSWNILLLLQLSDFTTTLIINCSNIRTLAKIRNFQLSVGRIVWIYNIKPVDLLDQWHGRYYSQRAESMTFILFQLFLPFQYKNSLKLIIYFNKYFNASFLC